MRGQPCPRAEAVLPLREISYAWVANASEVLTPGQAVKVVVTWHQTEPTSKVRTGAGLHGRAALNGRGGEPSPDRPPVTLAATGVVLRPCTVLLDCASASQCTAAEPVPPSHLVAPIPCARPAKAVLTHFITRAACLPPSPPLQVVVSLKRLEDDPLQETLDKVLPLNEASCTAAATR